MSPILGIWASQNYVRTPATSYESIATQTLSSAASTITFSSIPSTYKHLQIRGIARQSSGDLNQTFIRLNGDTGANYSGHTLVGDGASASTAGSINSNGTYMNAMIKPGSNQTTGIFGVLITDILDYTNTNKNTTIRSLSGVDANGSGYAWFASGTWYNTAAVTSITFTTETNNFISGSTFALYGIKG